MSPQKVRCRQIQEADLEAVADLLTRGFPLRARKYWTTGLNNLRARPSPNGCPQFGYLLEAEGAVVGAILLIFTQSGTGEAAAIRCNVSSWYVDPDYRAHGALMVSQALKLKHVTYVNISAADHTLPMLKAQGYTRYSQGQFVALPALARGVRGLRARAFSSERDRDLPEFDLLRAHAEAGCRVLVCEEEAGRTPFVFARRRIAYAPFGVLQLVWCRDTGGFVRCAGALGRRLLGDGVLAVLCDAEAPVPGLVGRFFADKAPRFFKGPERPRPNDLSFTELVLFGA